jgi:serine/threonine-protein kinase
MNFDPTEIAALLPFEKRYELRRQCWADGLHTRWEAFDRVLEREVWINKVHPASDTSFFIKRAKTASALRHPNILPVYDLGIVGNTTPFYTTPLVRVASLDTLLGERERNGDQPATQFPLKGFVGAVRDACRALEHAHRHGFLHLDLHPGCLLVGEGFREILLDHGWEEMRAHMRDDSDAFRVFGRPAYMSPEQVNEAGPGVGPATDVFGLGGILHVILFGTPPNHLPAKASVVEVIRAVADRAFDPRRPGTLRPQIGGRRDRKTAHELTAICLKALSYEPEDRYPSAAAFGAALDEWEEKSRSAWLPGLWRW